MSITRDIIRVRSVRSHVEGDDVGYIRLTQFNEQTTDGLKKAIADIKAKVADDKLKGYILDLRNNPGGLLDQAISVSDAFLQKGEIVSTRGRNAEETQRFNARAGDLTKGKPVIVLINGGSASASEIVAGALQDHKRATVLGTRSFGKGSVQTIIPLGSGNGALRLTTARYFTPSGRSIQAKGIAPDIEVLQDVPDDLKAKTDTKRARPRCAAISRATPARSRPARSPTFRRTPKNDKALHHGGRSAARHPGQFGLPAECQGPGPELSAARSILTNSSGAAFGPPRSFAANSPVTRRNRRVLDSADDSRGFAAVASDDLNAPLGQDKGKRLPKLPAAAPQLLAGVLGLFGLAVVAWAIFVNDPLGGEPTAVVATGRRQSQPRHKPSTSRAGRRRPAHSRHDGQPAGNAASRQARPSPPRRRRLRAARPSPSSTAPAASARTSSSRASRASLRRRRRSTSGSLETHPARRHPEDRARTARGRSALYAHPRKLPAAKTDAPRIAIIVGGLGISATGTADALCETAGAGDASRFAPYGADLEQLAAARARAKSTKCCCRRRWSRSTIPTTIPARRRC